MNEKIIVIEFHSHDDSYGIFLDGSRVYSGGLELENEDKRYTFKFYAMFLKDRIKIETKNIQIEDISFSATLNPKNFLDNQGELSIEKIIEKFAKKEYEYATERLKRFLKIESLNMSEYNPSYIGNLEFLKFTKETACHWGGPYELNGDEGCKFWTEETENKISSIEPIDFRRDWSYWHLPYSFREENKNLKDSEIYYMSKEEKEFLFNTFPIQIQFEICSRIISLWSQDGQQYYLKDKLPFRIVLSGNDDCSYSKFFCTREQMKNEIKYLRGMQPLDMIRDIYNRDYIFTN